jgi:hypothetical protein
MCLGYEINVPLLPIKERSNEMALNSRKTFARTNKYISNKLLPNSQLLPDY